MNKLNKRINYTVLKRLWEFMAYQGIDLAHGWLEDALLMEDSLLVALIGGAQNPFSDYPETDYPLSVIAPELEKATGVPQGYFIGNRVFYIPGMNTAMWELYFESTNPFEGVGELVTQMLEAYFSTLPMSGGVLDNIYFYFTYGEQGAAVQFMSTDPYMPGMPCASIMRGEVPPPPVAELEAYIYQLEEELDRATTFSKCLQHFGDMVVDVEIGNGTIENSIYTQSVDML